MHKHLKRCWIINIYTTRLLSIYFTYHSSLDFNVNAVLHSSPDLSDDGRTDERVGAAPLSIPKNLVHLVDRSYGRSRSTLVHLDDVIWSRLYGEEVGMDNIIGLEVVFNLNKRHEVTFSWKRNNLLAN